MARVRRISLRLDDQEYADALIKAKRTGIKLSDFVRQCILKGQAVSQDDLHLLKKELNRIGVNVNQLARKANTIGYSDDIHIDFLSSIETFKKVLLRVSRGW